MGLTADGKIAALEFDDITGIGPFSMYPRTSAIEANQVLNLTGAPYVLPNYRARGRVVFQNKNMMCQYRAVGHPIAMAICDCLLEDAAAGIGMDPVELRRKNLILRTQAPQPMPEAIHTADAPRFLVNLCTKMAPVAKWLVRLP